jgi:hypothetical protein
LRQNLVKRFSGAIEKNEPLRQSEFFGKVSAPVSGIPIGAQDACHRSTPVAPMKSGQRKTTGFTPL